MKISNIIKFIIALTVIFGIAGFLSFELYKNANNFYDELEKIEGSEFKGPAAYLFKILNNSEYQNLSMELKNDFSSLQHEYQTVRELNRVKYNNVIICLMAISSVSLITIGILIFKLTKEKAIGLGIITGSILTSLTYIFILYVMLYNVTLG